MALRTIRQMGNQEHSPRLGIQSSGAKGLCNHNGTKTANLGLIKPLLKVLRYRRANFYQNEEHGSLHYYHNLCNWIL
jgi:hypothetical protein